MFFLSLQIISSLFSRPTYTDQLRRKQENDALQLKVAKVCPPLTQAVQAIMVVLRFEFFLHPHKFTRSLLTENSGIQNTGEILAGGQSSADAAQYLLQSRTGNVVTISLQ